MRRASVHTLTLRRAARWLLLLFFATICATICAAAHAGGPRFVTGTTYTKSGQPMAFYTSHLLYYTDSGDLNANVPHAEADAMVAAAAAVWNVPTSSLTLAQGGTLAEHVSTANTTFDGTTVDFPPDVEASNYLNIPIAVLYDTDGSLIDLLLGAGASNPVGCRQNGVVESVDGFGQNGTIQHALLILNGLCVGSTTAQLTQMQYQLTRAFGRILGLSWSQVNDNVFTADPQPSSDQMSYWPVMHPIDIICGAYSYQCMTNPFTLRPDDLDTLALLYPVTAANQTAGKTLSTQNVVNLIGVLQFPSGQGMEMLNVTVHRTVAGHDTAEPWQVVASITGAEYQQNIGNPVTGIEPASANVGSSFTGSEGSFSLPAVPDSSVATLFLVTEPINPLYTGEYALGPYQRPPITPSGTSVTLYDFSARAGSGQNYNGTTVPDAAAATTATEDGTRSAPAAPAASGWWKGLLCPSGHTSWFSATIKAGTSWTVEATALDESGAATTAKAQPVLGVWSAGTSGLPDVAAAPVPMNALQIGMTQLQIPANSTDGTYTIAVADQFGGGRPDFAYQARLLYAASVSPAAVSTNGGAITITGTGFQQGNYVLVDGDVATVLSVTPTQIVALAPSAADAGANPGDIVDVMVLDTSTGGSTDISAAISYTTVPAYTVKLLPPIPSSLETGASVPLIVQVVAIDGGAPLSGDLVELSSGSGAASLAVCNGATSCVVETDANGEVQTTLTGVSAGAVTLTATDLSGGATLSIPVVITAPTRSVALNSSGVYAPAGVAGSWALTLTALQDGQPSSGVGVTWTAGAGLSLVSADGATSGTGQASVSVQTSAVQDGVATVTGCAWSGVCATWTLNGVDPSQWVVSVTGGAGQSVSAGSPLASVVFQVTDEAGHILPDAPVMIYQTIDAWEGVCPTEGRCPAAPVLENTETTLAADSNGLVSIAPLVLPGEPQVANLAAVTGTQGFATVSVTEHP